MTLRRIVPLLGLAFGSSTSPRPKHLLLPPPPVTREFRAAWATPIADRGFRDWPSRDDMTPDEQRAELRAMLDQASAAGLNAVILHVRLAGDALYPTPYAPWSAFLTGKSGVGPSPAYDPLAFAVDEAHARGLQLHAWFNPFRAMLPNFAGKASPKHVTKAHPSWVVKYGSQTWIDPGEPAARKQVLETILDVVRRYDVDGVHLDDYFYPYREVRTVVRRVHGKRVRRRVELDFPDTRTWTKYGRGHFESRADWRRANIDSFVKFLYKDVKSVKPWVAVGLSPFGIWRSGTPAGITGLDAYAELYADSRRWLREGWLDYLTPQLYWPLDGAQRRFSALDAWWRSENVSGRYVWPGLYTSQVYGSNPWPMNAIRDEIVAVRDTRIGTNDPPGEVHFRMGALSAADGRLAASLAGVYREPALVPAFSGLGAAAPAAPRIDLVAPRGPASYTIAPGDTVPVRWWLIQSRNPSGEWTSALRPAGEGRLSAADIGASGATELAITAISRTGVASAPALVAAGQGSER
jgi:uncharacterized lipoprotein YddW (UPF0748 family)